HLSALPWQLSQPTPSASWKRQSAPVSVPSACSLTSASPVAWHFRHSGIWCAGRALPSGPFWSRLRAMRTERTLNSTWYARAGLSWAAQVLYSARFLPFGPGPWWQAIAEHDATPCHFASAAAPGPSPTARAGPPETGERGQTRLAVTATAAPRIRRL